MESRKTASGRSWLPNFSRGTFGTISLSRFPPVEEDRALVDRHAVIRTWSYTINTKRKSGHSSRCSHEAEDSLPSLCRSRPCESANHRHHRRGRSATDSVATASRRRPRAIELCIMPNALAKQYDRLECGGGEYGGDEELGEER